MHALAVLYAGNLTGYAFEPFAGGRSALDAALEAARAFPGAGKVLVFTDPGFDSLAASAGWRLPPGAEAVFRPSWTRTALLEALSEASPGFDLTFYAWADAPFLDPALAAALAERHLRYAAEYSYADGWPYGLAPELLAPGVAGILAKISREDKAGEVPVGREALFDVIRKDINAFDIETELSPVDFRQHRISLTADSRRNFLLVRRFAEAGFAPAERGGGGSGQAGAGTAGLAGMLAERPEMLRTLPAFYGVQVSAACPQSCLFCPWPKSRAAAGPGDSGGFMPPERFAELLDRAAAFSGDAVIDLSLWGELSLHPAKLELIDMVLARSELSLIVETSGVGWKRAELEALAGKVSACSRPPLPWMAPAGRLSWILSLDTAEEGRYREIRGAGFAGAVETAKSLLELFPGDTWVQALRIRDAEDDTEKFYRYWKEFAGTDHIIIQKYDDFAGALPKRQGADLSPVERRPCWHLQRDMSILLDGSVPWCREDVGALDGAEAAFLGNIFREGPELIWDRGGERYRKHCSREYPGICAGCDEYYTFNF